MIGFYAKFTTAAENRDALIALLSQAAASMSAIPECRIYIVNRDASDASVTWVTEIWDNAEAHQASLKNDSAKALIAKAMPLLSEMPKQTRLDPIGGKGI